MNLIPVDLSEEHYRICKVWFEDKNITRWLTSALRFARYPKIMHEMLITNKKNKLFFICIDDKPVGLIGLSNIDPVDKRAEMWCVIGFESDRGKNIGTRANCLMENLAAQNLNLATLYAFVSETNKAAIRALEKSGFKYAGKFRHAFFLDGECKNLLIFDWVNPELDIA